MTPDFLKPSQVAARLGVCKRTVLNMCRSELMPHYRFGDKTIRITEAQLEQFCRSSERGSK